LLTKQGWRIFQHPETLLHRVLKCKYFPHGSFLEAPIPVHSSYTWRSIAQSRDIIRRGSRWRIGNGGNVKIWQDQWLKGTHSGRILSNPLSQAPDTRVCRLIDPVFNCWRPHLIAELFSPHDASLILKTPLPPRPVRDSLLWNHTSTGQLTVKSVYSFLWGEQEVLPNNPSSSSRCGIRQFWKWLWSISVPNKLKTFMWRACNNILPTLTNLWKKGIVSATTCYLCGEEAETVSHVLWSCPFAVSIWQSLPLFSALPLGASMDFQDVVHCALQILPSPDIEIFVTAAWMIWRRRNEVWQGQLDPPSSNPNIFLQAAAYSAEFLDCSQHLSKEGKQDSNKAQHWYRPKQGLFKVNVGVKVFDIDHLGVGVLVCDSNGDVLAALSELRELKGDNLWSVAHAVWQALQFCKDVGYHSVLVEFSNGSLMALLQ
jgi:hypothetical protein